MNQNSRAYRGCDDTKHGRVDLSCVRMLSKTATSVASPSTRFFFRATCLGEPNRKVGLKLLLGLKIVRNWFSDVAFRFTAYAYARSAAISVSGETSQL